jgi:hypothetical protein
VPTKLNLTRKADFPTVIEIDDAYVPAYPIYLRLCLYYCQRESPVQARQFTPSQIHRRYSYRTCRQETHPPEIEFPESQVQTRGLEVDGLMLRSCGARAPVWMALPDSLWVAASRPKALAMVAPRPGEAIAKLRLTLPPGVSQLLAAVLSRSPCLTVNSFVVGAAGVRG